MLGLVYFLYVNLKEFAAPILIDLRAKFNAASAPDVPDGSNAVCIRPRHHRV